MTIPSRWSAFMLALAACSNTMCADKATPGAVAPTAVSPRSVTTTRTLTVEDFAHVVYDPGREASYAPTTSIEHDAIDTIVRTMLDAARSETPPDPAHWADLAARAEMRIERWTVAGESYWALVETRARGAGAYVFRVGGVPEDGPLILLQAPHAYYDLGTGELAAQMFFTPGAATSARPRALFTNTIHRYQLSPGDKKKRATNPADVAHNPEHAYTTATAAFARAAGRSVRVIQLHGFGARTDDETEGDPATVAVVVSAGDAAGSTATTSSIASQLATILGEGVRRFPEDVQMLGATTNVQGRLLRGIRGASFVHVEMSAAVRKRLASDAATRGRVADALFGKGAP